MDGFRSIMQQKKGYYREGSKESRALWASKNLKKMRALGGFVGSKNLKKMRA